MIQQGQTDLFPALWETVQPFCERMAQKYLRKITSAGMSCACDAEDLTQSAYFALCKACDSFDSDAGVLFTTHLAWHLRSAFSETVGIRSTKRDPSLRSQSLDAPLSEDEDAGSLYDIIPSSSKGDPAAVVVERVFREELHAALEAVIVGLPRQEAELLRLMYWKRWTPEQIAESTGQPLTAIHRSREKAIRRLRHATRYTRPGRALRGFLETEGANKQPPKTGAVCGLAFDFG